MRILMAERINRRSSGVLVKPWELESIGDEYWFAYDALETVAHRHRARQAHEKLFQDFRRKMKYRQYTN